MDDLWPVVLIPVVIVLAILNITWRSNRSLSMIEQWARENGYELLSSERRWFFRGPFSFWSGTKKYTIYYVSVRDGGGNIRRGWVRCGGWFLGLWSDAVCVEWDK
jgi:hypothetical protein